MKKITEGLDWVLAVTLVVGAFPLSSLNFLLVAIFSSRASSQYLTYLSLSDGCSMTGGLCRIFFWLPFGILYYPLWLKRYRLAQSLERL